MGRRCKKCEMPQIDKQSTLCPTCEIEAIVPSSETDAEFAQLFEEHYGATITSDVSLDGDIFSHRERLNRLVSTEENKSELENLENIQKLIEQKKEKLKNKLLVQAISADINKTLSPRTFHQPSSLATPKVPSSSIKWEENCTPPSKYTFDHNSNVIFATPLLSSPIPGLGKTPEVKKEVMDFVENVTDEIDGDCIFNQVVQDETVEDQEPTLRKVVRRRSSVKDRIKAFEMLSKR